MSEDNEAVDTSCCAYCGIAEIDDIKLMDCDDCDLVKYCSDACQKNHKPEHEEACKKRAAQLRDELLFKQPESSHFGDCPICSLPLSLFEKKSIMYECCSKAICNGCAYVIIMRGCNSCPFCRKSTSILTDEEEYKRRMKRIEANDPVAIREEGFEQCEKGNYIGALDYLTKAAELGDAEAHYRLSLLYKNGEGVEKDIGKEIYHAEEAAIGGHPKARHNLGICEWNNKKSAERAVKHWIIAAKQGHDGSIKALMQAFKRGHVSKDDLAAALRAHQAAVNATKSPQREAAEEFYGLY
eukprot:scaffold31384_cov166-Skeletonema_menzelii.AAC.1